MSVKDFEDMNVWKSPEDEQLADAALEQLGPVIPDMIKSMLEQANIKFSIKEEEETLAFDVEFENGYGLRLWVDGIVKDIILKDNRAKVMEFDRTVLEEDEQTMDFQEKVAGVLKVRMKIVLAHAEARNSQDLKKRLTKLYDEGVIHRVWLMPDADDR